MVGWKRPMKHAYQRFSNKELILRDILAIERTILSTERTFYSTVRTSLTLLVAGLTVLNFVQDRYVRMSGWFVILTALILMIIGILRLFVTLKKLRSIAHYAPSAQRA